ncbi:Thiamine-phosphate synthase [Rubripirellula obstinata]|uniref:Thiamine-phosphate synthase n=1 Tax=Rubripirellula obstinata TaxID=406547 RepID=A0A5B1CM86_9BACT|nr:thiamine phosphate synthase [Rubripirellula obstinata]KAA1261015.1 Thiamine-phosphate synthase [Rubripirellula obstinata]
MNKNSEQAVLRILDASANRVGEGLRTVEEWARFALDGEALSAELKAIRHQVSTALAVLPRTSLLAARDTLGDVGTKISQDTERVRDSASGVVAAGISRTGQSLRVIEEYLKTINADAAATIEQARYRFYTASANLELLIAAQDRQSRMQDARLYALIDAGTNEAEFQATVTTLCESGVDVLQLRDSSSDDRTLIARARIGTEIARKCSVLFIMNDRADLALAADCDGVHVGQEELPGPVARKIVGHDRIVGISTHSIDQAIQAVADGADYIGCGPVFPSRTKSFDEFAGLEYVREVSAQIQIPSFAIGGINESNLDQVIKSGCCRIALTAALRDCEDVTATATRFKKKLMSANLK